MVLYKLPIERAKRLLVASAIDKAKFVTKRIASLSALKETNGVTPVISFSKEQDLRLWTMVTDTIFGGSSTCSLSLTENQSFLFSGSLCGTLRSEARTPFSTPGLHAVNSFCRMWYIYVLFHKDLSDFSGLLLTYRLLNDNNNEDPGEPITMRNYQMQFQHNEFLEDNYFYCPFNWNSEKTTFRDEKNIEWTRIRLPFNRFAVNRMGKDLGVSNDWFKSDTIPEGKFPYVSSFDIPTADITSMGVSVTANIQTNFSIELKSIEAY
jgi:hypothetical protein